jgi:ssDNA-binding Zn-finger/Zn-ribbon topoisomerase 1
VSFDPENSEASRDPVFKDVWHMVETRVTLFLIQEGFVPKEEDRPPHPRAVRHPSTPRDTPGKVPWERPMGFGAVVGAYLKFNSYTMEVILGVYPMEEDPDKGRNTFTSTVTVAIEGEDEYWQDLLKRKIKIVIERGMDALNLACPHCGGKMKERKINADGPHKGETFYGCASYPRCRGARFPWTPETESHDDEGKWAFANCPDCKAPLVIRYAKKGQYAGDKFYGCKAYPKCKRIVSPEELSALRLMQGEEANQPWEWFPPDPQEDEEKKLLGP